MPTDPATSTTRPLAALARVLDLVLLVIVAVGLSSVILGRVLPIMGHPVYVVAGPSMAPAIGTGSVVVLDAVAPSALAVGDVVSLQSGTQRAVFTHRITRIAELEGELWIETKGDANGAPDPSITPVSAIIGRVALTVPHAGYLLALMSTPQGVVLVLSTGAMLLVLGWWLDDVVRSRRREAAAKSTAPHLPAVTIPAVAIPAAPSPTKSAGDGPVRNASRRRAEHPARPVDPARRRSSRPTRA